MKFSITTPEKLLFEKEIEQVTLPTKEGEITILKNHIPLVGILSSGVLTLVSSGIEEVVAITGGFFKVKENKIVVLADSAEKGEEINLEKVQEAKDRVEKALIDARNREDVDYTGLQAVLEREVARLKTVKKHRSHHGVNLN